MSERAREREREREREGKKESYPGADTAHGCCCCRQTGTPQTEKNEQRTRRQRQEWTPQQQQYKPQRRNAHKAAATSTAHDKLELQGSSRSSNPNLRA